MILLLCCGISTSSPFEAITSSLCNTKSILWVEGDLAVVTTVPKVSLNDSTFKNELTFNCVSSSPYENLNGERDLRNLIPSMV